MPPTRTAEHTSPPGRLASHFTSPADVWLAVRVIAWAAVLPLLKRIMPLQALASRMHGSPQATDRNPARERRILAFARGAARLVRWRSGGNCLERGLIAYRYLGHAGAKPVLVVGLDVEAGNLLGHAWVLIDGRPAGESAASLARYVPAFAFDPDGRLTALPERGVEERGSR